MRTFYIYIILALNATTIFAQPANDACSGAISIPVTNGTCTSIAYTNVGATSVGDPATPPCWSPNSLSNTVWFSFVAPSTAVEVSTNFGFALTNTQVAIYSGNCGALTLIGCNEDINTSLALFHTNIQLQGLTVGNTYFIMIDGNGNTTGDFGVCAQQITPASPPLPIQDCPTARFLCNTNPISIADGTGGPGIIQEAPSCFGAPGERASWWYSFTAANNGTLCFNILPTTNVDYDFAVYNTTNGCLGTELACNWSGLTGANGQTGLSGAAGAQYTPCLNVTAGQTYSILVDRFTSTSAAGFTLSFTGTVQFASPNPSFTTNTVCTGNPTQFTNTTNGSNTYSWNFGNGVTSTLQNPTFTYPAAGVYNASLLVTSIPGGCQNLTTRSVTVTDPPTVNAGTSTSVCPGGCVTLNGTTNASGGVSGPVTFNNNTVLNIPDNNTTGVTSTINVSGINPTTIAAGSILNVCLNITHTWDSDLDIFLRCPNGTQIELSTDNGGAGDNYTNTCFSMSAATLVTAGAAPFNGTFIPEQSFNLLNGCNVNGNWQLVILDDLGGDVGTLTNWSITFNNTLSPFSWSPTTAMTNSGTLTPSVCPATTTTYTLTAVNAAGCTSTSTVTITPTALTATPTANNSSCNGGNNGSVNVALSGGAAPFSFIWSNGRTTQNNTGLAAGTYTVTVSDNGGCTTTATANVTAPSAVTVTPTVNNVSCNGINNGSVTLNVSGGTSGYNFNWGTGITSQNRTGLSPGTYTVTVSDANACTTTSSATITEPTSITVSNTSANVTCNNQNNGSIDVTASGGTGVLAYNWGGGIISEDRNNLAPGVYTVTVTDANNCTSTNTATITEPTAISVTNSSQNAVCNGQLNGSIDITANGGTGILAYNWGSGITSEDRTGLAAGSYTVTVTDANLCTTTNTVVITEPTVLNATNTVSNASCNSSANGSIDLTASGGTGVLSYNWGGGITSEDRTGLAAGVYTVTVTDANACTTTSSATITEPTSITVSNTSANVTCNNQNNGSIDVTASGGTGVLAYNWGGGIISEDRNNLAPGVYTVTVTDANNCTSTNTATITEPTAISVTNSSQNAVCNGQLNGSIDITANGGTGILAYNWGSGITSEDRTGLAAGSYTVTVTDANLCTTTNTVVITEPTVLNATNTVSNASCNSSANGSIDLTASGGTGVLSYNWGGGITSEDRTGLAAGVYTVTVTDANACTTTSSATITEPSALNTNTITLTDATCFAGGTVEISANGGTGSLSFVWSNGATTQDLNGVSAGSYTVTITDANGCSITNGPNVVNAIGTPTANVTSVINVSCNGSANGSIDLNISGGSPNYTYTWSNGATTQDLNGLSGGTYAVTVTDNIGCTAVQTGINITEPTALTVTNTSTNVSCNNGNNGTTLVTVLGGTAGYSYIWNNGSTSEDLNNISAGSYTLTVSDANGCNSILGPISISQPTALSLSNVTTTSANCGAANGTITLTTNGGVTPYIYSWSNGATSEDLNNLPLGNYSLSVTDANGCEYTQSFSISGGSDISITLSSVDEGCGQPNSGSVDLSPSGGTLPLTYNWSNGVTTEDLTTISAGSYSVTVSDANGCSISANTSIAAAFQPTLNAAVLPSNARDTLITWGDLTSLTGGSDQTAQGVTYTWTSIGPSNANFTTPNDIGTEVEPDDDGIYQFIITAISAEGCVTTDTLNVDVRANNPAIPTAFSPNNDGTNDNFRVVNMDKRFIREFKVYNRWGEVIYDNATEAEWDGKFKGTEQPRDVYMYIISWESSTGNGDVIKRGNITLLR
jgi:gliding motility-associated-like protein